MKTAAIVLAVLILMPLATVAAAAWYSLYMPGTAHHGPLVPLSAEEAGIAGRLRHHVLQVASEPHNTYHYAALRRSAFYIEAELVRYGYTVVRHTYMADGLDVWNIEATWEPQAETPPAPSLVIGAHYDSCGNAPGANDNGSGVAALLEIARLLKAGPSPRQLVRIVFFVNEEPPFFKTELMGSWQFATMLRARGEHVAGMISLETLGAFSDLPGSQKYPWPFDLILPDVGNFIAFVAMPGSRQWTQRVIGAFRRHARFPTIGAIAPRFVQGADWSDHGSFASLDMPALMITDTALFRDPNYHRPTDTPEKLDYDRLARVTKGLERALVELTR